MLKNASDAELLAAMEAAPNKRSYRPGGNLRAFDRLTRARRSTSFSAAANAWCGCGSCASRRAASMRWRASRDQAGRVKSSSSGCAICFQNDPKVELWYGDECGVEGDPRPRRRWSARGSRPRAPRLGNHIRADLVGAVCPVSGKTTLENMGSVHVSVFLARIQHLMLATLP